jgi:hypothetical protein
MELLAMRQQVGGDRYADRATGVARRAHQCRGIVALAWRYAIIGFGYGRQEDQKINGNRALSQRDQGPASYSLHRSVLK